MTRQLELSNSKTTALVDDEDYEAVRSHVWMLVAAKGGDPLRVLARTKQGELVYLHHLVTSTHHHTHAIRFKNGSPVDCRRINLLVDDEPDMRFVPKQHRS